MKKWQSVVKVPLFPMPIQYPIRELRERTSGTSMADEKAEAAGYQ
jgi:hypothetical protein